MILPGRGEVVFYVDANFRGASHSFTADVAHLGGLKLGDKFSSLKTDPATSVEVFEHGDFKGKSKIYSGAVASFGDLNDKVLCRIVVSSSSSSSSSSKHERTHCSRENADLLFQDQEVSEPPPPQHHRFCTTASCCSKKKKLLKKKRITLRVYMPNAWPSRSRG